MRLIRSIHETEDVPWNGVPKNIIPRVWFAMSLILSPLAPWSPLIMTCVSGLVKRTGGRSKALACLRLHKQSHQGYVK